MGELTPQAREVLDRYLGELRDHLAAMPAEDREHMVADVRERALASIPQRLAGPEELRSALAEIGPPDAAAEAILAEHRCSWCNRIHASVEPFEAILQGEPLSLRAEGPTHREKLLRYVAFAEKTLGFWFGALFAEGIIGVLLVVLSILWDSNELLMAAVSVLTMAPGLTFIIFPFIAARGLGSTAQRFNEAIGVLSASRAILLARLIGFLLVFLGIYAVSEMAHHPLWRGG